MDRLKEFVVVSERLTGHSHTELMGTGSAEHYLQTLHRAVPEQVLDDLLATAHDPTADDAVTAGLLADPRLGPVARNIILLWYCGTWQQLDDSWRREYDGQEVEAHVVSANAYLSGLQWTVARAHAPGGNMQGFAAWSRRPEGEAS
jgi:hypothetical protein